MSIKIAINGFGRIGRNVFKLCYEHNDIEIVAINDLTDAKTLAHLLKYDSVHGRFSKQVDVTDEGIVIDGTLIRISAIKDPKQLPWKELNIDVIYDDRDSKLGSKLTDWELIGIPTLAIIGSKEVKNNVVTLKNRIKDTKIEITIENLLDKFL